MNISSAEGNKTAASHSLDTLNSLDRKAVVIFIRKGLSPFLKFLRSGHPGELLVVVARDEAVFLLSDNCAPNEGIKVFFFYDLQ